MTVSASASATSSTASAKAPIASSASAHASWTYSRIAAATWSFRDRPAWIFRPTSPSERSIAEWTSSSSAAIAVGSSPARISSTSASSSLVEQPGGVQAPRVPPRSLAVVREQLRVVRAEELPHLGGERGPRPGRPRASNARRSRARTAASSPSSEASRMKPSAASCGNVSPVAYDASVSA